jgi:hypothetical protein
MEMVMERKTMPKRKPPARIQARSQRDNAGARRRVMNQGHRQDAVCSAECILITAITERNDFPGLRWAEIVVGCVNLKDTVCTE